MTGKRIKRDKAVGLREGRGGAENKSGLMCYTGERTNFIDLEA